VARAPRLLAVTGGHRVDMADFTAMLDAVCTERGWVWAHATQPEAQRWLREAHAGQWDAVLLHDIPGLRLARGRAPEPHGPSADEAAALVGLLRAGQGLVVTHHALAAWPAWDAWANVVGGRYLYAPGELRGVELPASGYRMAVHHVNVLAPAHPVCAGVEPFEVDDELYLCPVHEAEVEPLLATTASMDPELFIDTLRAVQDGHEHACPPGPPGSHLVGWAKAALNSPVVYLQPGHGPETMRHPMYRRLLGNAVEWVASAAAHEWARANSVEVE